MTEIEFLTSTDPQAMLSFLQGEDLHGHRLYPATGRKLRLFAGACWRAWTSGWGKPTLVEQWEREGCGQGTDYEWVEHWVEIDESGPWPKRAERANLLRDLFGNPFRPVLKLWMKDAARSDRMATAFVPGPLITPTVLAVASAIYEERRFDEMPILGDALEESGATCQELLDHCRADVQHVRGCFAIDLILGKE